MSVALRRDDDDRAEAPAALSRAESRAMMKRKLRLVIVDARAAHAERPRTRGECVDGPRPCPWVSCRHHLYLEVREHNGHLWRNHPAADPDELPESCSLDVADRIAAEGRIAEWSEVGRALGISATAASDIGASAIYRAGRGPRPDFDEDD